ncbi:MAG: AI-2E family transporter, partial [Rhodopirellula bahusiensis]
IWGWMWGIMGVFLSVPILIAARMACEGYDELRPLAMILGAEIPEPDAPKPNTENETSASTADSEKRHVPHENVPSTHSPIPQSISQ